MMGQTDGNGYPLVLALLFIEIVLIVFLIFFYKRLNKEANGEYTIRRIVYKEGGVRDQVRGVVLALETRLGVQLWPGGDSSEDGEEMQEVQDEEEQVDEGSSQGSENEEDDQEEEDRDEQEEGKGGDTDDNSSLGNSEADEHVGLVDQPEAKGGTDEKAGAEDGKGEASGGAGLLIDLKQFSGSAIWSEEKGGEAKESDVTAL